MTFTEVINCRYQTEKMKINLLKSVATAFLLSSVSAFSPAVPRAQTRKQQTHLFVSESSVDEDDSSRRNVIIGGGLLALGLGIFARNDSGPAPGKTIPLYQNVATDIEALVKDDYDKGPTLVRLAWHSSGTYDKMSKTGGSGGGTMYFKEELDHGANAGLERTAVSWLEPIKEKYGADLSYADLYTLGGGKINVFFFSFNTKF